MITVLGSFSIHDASGSVNFAIKMNSDFLPHRKRCDVYVSVVIDKTSHKAIFQSVCRIRYLSKQLFHNQPVPQLLHPEHLLHVLKQFPEMSGKRKKIDQSLKLR